LEASHGTAVLDSAHIGDIEGALGRISLSDTARPRSLKIRLAPCWRSSGPA
jgi:hypothetical protein